MKPEPEAELQATANLSPISPSPVHSVAPQVVPALQDRVDTIDAMVAAASAAANASAGNDIDLDPLVGAGDDDVVDDDSFNDPYGEIDQDLSAQPQHPPQEEQELPDINDDYAKTFDSPIGLEEVEGGDVQPEDVSSMPRESNQVSLSSQHLTSYPSKTSHAAPESPSTSAQQAQPGASTLTAALPEAEAHPDESTTSTSTEHPPNPGPTGSQSVTSPSTTSAGSNSAGSPNPSADIQRLVADLTAPAEPTASDDPSALSAKAEVPAGASSVLPSSASLPPRPPLPQAASQSYTSQHHPSASNSSIPASVAVPPTPGQPSTYVAAGAPGLSQDALGNLPPVATGLNASAAITSMTAPPYPPQSPTYATDRPQDADYQRQWDQFMADERQYMSEAKWDRFPEGSRLFIGTRSASGASKNGAHIFSTGNLSSDKVSKRDVFDLFHRFGRLAQISLKSAYGFVQYHTVDEGHAALENLQGIEIKGRRIHLEISRVQDKSKKERNRSPERARGRDGGGREGSGRDGSGRDGGGRRNDRFNHQNRDDYRPARTHSPRRNDYQREEGYGRDRGFHDGGRGRGRSRSPSGYARNDKESYRRRSPSPYGRPRHEAEIDLPRRYGADVPDVQIILQPDVNRDFVNWVEQIFKSKGLKSEVMFLHPRIPKDAVIQRQAAEGVHAVVDLDLRAQNLGRIPVQAFDRSAGLSNVRFDQYVDLDPPTAAEVILRAKASGATAAYSQPYGAVTYTNPYAGQPQHLGGFPVGQPANQYAQQIPANATDVAGLMGQVDNATLQRLLASIQNSGQGATAQHMSNAAVSGASQVDIQAILGSLGGNAAAQQQAAVQGAYGAAYGAQAAPNGGVANGDSAVQVQNIMAQLARWRQ
ncbi:nuclear polyadenylated RNA-binding protein 3 [Neonectria magnoliae]|uniref:Nuclear polyadenylated RNA-binding protein 3 n=1 Tax=Neonectria magnoliae TaxID=2732573 RepID=A0ABR1HLE3_9HYPO